MTSKKTLNPTAEQQAIIDAQEGTVEMMAAVGSGKTTTLGLRVEEAVKRGVPPERILALTFTNRAADQLRESLRKRIPEDADKVELSTFHGLCAKILRSACNRVELPPDFMIIDEEDAIALLRELDAASDAKEAKSVFYRLGRDASSIPLNTATQATWFKGQFSDIPVTRKYVGTLTEWGAVDFAGLVILARAVLLTDAEVGSHWRQRFDMVMVDEIQDTHLSEYEVVRTLARDARSLCIVGDMDQTIYGWRGSKPKEILSRLRDDFGPVQEFSLSENFRSTEAILAVADRIAQGMADRKTQVRATSTLSQGTLPTLRKFPMEEAEAEHIANYCINKHKSGRQTRTNSHFGAVPGCRPCSYAGLGVGKCAPCAHRRI